MKKKALFIDRDGVINAMFMQKDGFFDSPQNKGQIRLVENIEKVIGWANSHTIPVIEISNQPGFALGKMNMETLEDIENSIHNQLAKKGATIDAAYRCFHHPKSQQPEFAIICDCRKPKPGLLLRAAREHDIDLESSVMIGDNVTDMEAAKLAGCATLLFVHDNDLPKKVEANKAYQGTHTAKNHKDTLKIIKKLL